MKHSLCDEVLTPSIQKYLLCGSEIGANAISVTGVVVVRIAVVVDIGEIGSGVQRLPDD